MAEDIIRVLRVIEYVGPRIQVEEQVKRSIHGQKDIGRMSIRVATLGAYPDVLVPENQEVELG